MSPLKNKTALITGSTSGIGLGIAEQLATAGANIILNGFGPPDQIEALRRKISETHPVQVRYDSADMSRPEAIAAMLKKAIAEFGAIDILVNNAGIIRRADAVDFTEADWDAVMDTNLKTLFFLCQGVGRHMIARGSGKIINIASMLTFQGGIRVPSYTASKSGVGGLTKLLANEWAAKGVQVNAIAPGYIATNNTAALQGDATRNRQIMERIPAGRWGDPSDIGGAAVFLASPASDYVQGHILAVDGGWLAR